MGQVGTAKPLRHTAAGSASGRLSALRCPATGISPAACLICLGGHPRADSDLTRNFKLARRGDRDDKGIAIRPGVPDPDAGRIKNGFGEAAALQEPAEFKSYLVGQYSA